jgi:hypothetical protein
MNLDRSHRQVLGQFVAAVRTTVLVVAMATALLLACFVFRCGDLLGEVGGQHEIGHLLVLAERQLTAKAAANVVANGGSLVGKAIACATGHQGRPCRRRPA